MAAMNMAGFASHFENQREAHLEKEHFDRALDGRGLALAAFAIAFAKATTSFPCSMTP